MTTICLLDDGEYHLEEVSQDVLSVHRQTEDKHTQVGQTLNAAKCIMTIITESIGSKGMVAVVETGSGKSPNEYSHFLASLYLKFPSGLIPFVTCTCTCR